MEQMIRCSNCGMENSAGQQFCGKCGAKLVTEVQQPKIKCPKCGFQNLVGQQFCGSCGSSLTATVQQVPTAPAQTQGAPTKVASSVALRQGVEVRPTWGLAWGLWWRMLVLGLLIGGIFYLIVAIVMVLAFNYKLPFGA